jgi:LDH2 family malate/lactate/ureidoglycolate dehydrogenase
MGRREIKVDSQELRRSVAAIFAALGITDEAANVVADALVEADEEGISSHGVMLVPMYADRLRNGSISMETSGNIISDNAACVVIDGQNVLGQLTAHQAVDIAADKAKIHGLAAVAVRNGFHFGTAGRYALELSQRGFIGIVMCNTRPLMPAPGGAEAITGNNPLAIAVPSTNGGPPVIVDMATSASAMGKIRVADGAGQSIPEGWATDSKGSPTQDPGEAIKGMLLPAAGPKGFGLAFLIDLICGGLSGGAIGPQVRPLYGDPAEPYRCTHFFLAIDVGHFRDSQEFAEVISNSVDRLRSSKPAPGIDRVMSPGEPGWRNKNCMPGSCILDRSIFDNLNELADELRTARVDALSQTT